MSARTLTTALLVGAGLATAIRAEGPAPLTPVPFQDVRIHDAFWGPRLRTIRTATVEANLRQCERTGRIRNFAIVGGLESGKHEGALFNDSDVYKVIEGVAYALADRRDPDLEKRADHIIDLIAAAQRPDGYLNTYYTLAEPQNRWKNIQHGHEMYCAGHLIEAAVAYKQATGKGKLLDVACRLADHIGSVFGPGKRIEACGHEELELALVKLYHATGQRRYLDQARFFLDARGRADLRRLFGEYAQDHKPVRVQTEVAGHAVRAMYLYCGMADVGSLTGDEGLLKAITAIWHDVVERKMYLTGGIGPSAHNEGFTVPYDLPNDTAYAETCAAIGMALWNHRMFLLSGDGKYADVLEREVYNGMLSGVNLAGDRFFYVNPLGSVGNHHRVPWFDCSCCPTNVVRYLPAMGERAWARRGNDVWAVLYLGNTTTGPLDAGKVTLDERTRYPWEGDIEIAVKPEKAFDFALHLRVPGWCRQAPTLSLNGQPVEGIKPERGYVTLARTWKAGDVVRLHLPMPVERVHADPRVKADVGRVALQRGPVVYCLEGVDNGGQVRNLVLPPDARLDAHFEKDLLGGVEVVTGQALGAIRPGEAVDTRPVDFKAIPYYAWDNRAPGQMIVWLARDTAHAEIPGEDGVVAGGVRIRASHLNTSDSLDTLNDGLVPQGSNDHAIRRMTWWDHKGTAEWLSYRFLGKEPRTLSEAAVYWFDDEGRGRCRVPAEWRLVYLDGGEWKPVKLTAGSAYGTARDQLNRVTFEPVRTRELRIEARLRPEFSGGVLKWVVGPAK
jgi:DUF1680 family protein